MHNYFYGIVISLVLTGCGGHQRKQSLANNYFEQATLAAHEGNSKKALQLLNKSLSVQETPQALAFKATILYQLNDVGASVSLFEKIINQTKNVSSTLRADIKNNYACVLNRSGNTHEAQHIWEGLTKDPDYLTPEVAHFNLALLSLSQKDFAAAVDKLQQAVSLAPDYVDAYFYLGMIYVHNELWDDAQQQFKSVLTYAPEHVGAREFLAHIDQHRALIRERNAA